MKYEIVRITEQNLHLLNAVNDDVFDEAIVPQFALRYVQQTNHALFVAVSDGVVVAQCQTMLHFHPDQRPSLYIDNLGVSEKHQRQGIASGIVAHCRAWANTFDARVYWVMTEEDNDVGDAFYATQNLRRMRVFYYEGDLPVPKNE